MKYIIIPVSFLILTIIVAAIFYARLPSEIAYHFTDGVPDRTMPPVAFLAWMIVPQVFFNLIAISITRLMMTAAKYAPPGQTPLLELLPIMGNMIALPQIVMFVAMVQLLLYNAYNTGLVPLWIFAVAILILGGVILGIMFMRIIRRYRRWKTKINQE